MSGRTGRQVVEDEERLAAEKRLIKTSDQCVQLVITAVQDADTAMMVYHLGSLTYLVVELTAALEQRHAAESSA